MSSPQCIAITGASGYVGRYVVEQLVSTGCIVRALQRRKTTPFPDSVECRQLDFSSRSELQSALQGADGIVHLAGRAHIFRGHGSTDAQAYRRSNRDLTAALGEAAALAGVKRFVFMSTVKVYGDQPSGLITEQTQPNPNDPYGQSKFDAECALQKIAVETGLESVIVRSTMVYGPHCTGNVRRLAGLLSRGIPLPLGAVVNKRSLINVRNVVEILIQSLHAEKAANQVLVAADGPPISTPEMIRSLSEGLGRPSRLVRVPVPLLYALGRATGRTSEISRLCGSLEVDVTKMQNLLGGIPLITTHEGLVDAGRSFRVPL